MLGAVMRLLTPLAAAAALALLVAPACAPVRAEPPWGAPDEGYAVEEPYDPEEAPDPDDYRGELGSYGDWYEDPRYGAVWRPTYSPGWEPYRDGYWAWTSYGWTWVSYEPWAWTLHYGRWAILPVHGWVWVPGTVWGPAWVDWYWGNGYVGWAPLSPFGHVTVINHFVFVNERDFCSREVRHHVVHHHHVSDRVRRHWRNRDHRAPRHDRIERVSRHTVTRLDGRPRHTLAPRRDRDRRVARPDMRPDLTGARRGRAERGEVRRERGDLERRSVSRPAPDRDRDVRRNQEPRVREPASRFDADDAARRSRRQPSSGWTGRSRIESHPQREPRLRAPRFDADDRPQLHRGHAWGGGRGGDARRAADPAAARMREGRPQPRMHEGGPQSGTRKGGPRHAAGGRRGDARGQAPGGTSMGFALGAR